MVQHDGHVGTQFKSNVQHVRRGNADLLVLQEVESTRVKHQRAIEFDVLV